MTEIIVSQENLKLLLKNQHRFYSFKDHVKNMPVDINEKYDDICNIINLLFKEQKDTKNSTLTDIVVSQQKLRKLMDTQHRFYSFEHQIRNMSIEVQNEYKELSNFVYKLLNEQNEKEEKEYQIKFEKFETVGMENDFETAWSIYKIEDINDVFGYVDAVGYRGYIDILQKEVTYLELWKSANKLILLSEDDHHIFIENFQQIKDTYYFELQTGS